jgi:hypothetical protein
VAMAVGVLLERPLGTRVLALTFLSGMAAPSAPLWRFGFWRVGGLAGA